MGGKDYSRGIHDLTEKAENDPYFLKLIGAGLIVDVEGSKIISPESAKKRAEKLLNRISKKQAEVKAKKAVSGQVVETEVEAPVAPPEMEDASVEAPEVDAAPPVPPVEAKEPEKKDTKKKKEKSG